MEKPQIQNETLKTLADVEREAHILKSWLLSQGANDYEFPMIESIIESVRIGEISAEEGLARLTKIKETKQER